MTVWILWMVMPYEPDDFIGIYKTEEGADKARRMRHDVPKEHDGIYRIEEYGVND
jgi:hypothetical protein